VVLGLVRRSHWLRLLGRALRPAGRAVSAAGRVLGRDDRPLAVDRARQRTGDLGFAVVAGGLLLWGPATLARVVVLVAPASR
jgi:NitT/TauT family transport system permease protein